MQNGKFKIGEYTIEPTTSLDTFSRRDYNVVNTKNGKNGKPVIGQVTVIRPKNKAAKNKEYGLAII